MNEKNNQSLETEIINCNSDFIFIYEAKQTNPNGDPDMENKPRMDYDTKTNLVSKFRRKRDIRDYSKFKGKDIFVDMIEDRKVTMDTKMEHVLIRFLENIENEKVLNTFDIWITLKKDLVEIRGSENKNQSIKEIYLELKNIKPDKLDKDKKKKIDAMKENFKSLNNQLLTYVVTKELYDIRLFGSAFAVEGFSKQFVGPVQINWGYSLHPVDTMKNTSLVTIMNDDNSTFGKNYNVEYSLIAFNGTISKNMANKTGLTNKDVEFFRQAMIKSINYIPTGSKANQYPILYLEVEYKPEFDGFLYDFRDFIDVEYREPIRKFEDLTIKIERLKKVLEDNKNIIKNIYIWECEHHGDQNITSELKKMQEINFFDLIFNNNAKGKK